MSYLSLHRAEPTTPVDQLSRPSHNLLMSTVNIHEAKTHLSRLVDAAVRGEEVVIARSNRPLVKRVPLAEAGPPRRLGTAAGEVKTSADFDEPLADFEGYQ